jgi:hypothetical protein
MNKAGRERILVVALMVLLGLAVWRLWGSLGGATPPPPTAGVTLTGIDTDQFSGVGLPEAWEIPDGGNGARDPFRYGAVPAPAAPPPPPPAPPPTFVNPPPAAPPAPPPLPLTYIGHGNAGAGQRAVIRDGDGAPHAVQAGEVLLGRYRIEEVTVDFVVVEDVQSGRRERLPRVE